MNLIGKKLQQRAIGECIEIQLRDGNSFVGVIADRDEECIELHAGNEELVVEYTDIKSVKSVAENSEGAGVLPYLKKIQPPEIHTEVKTSPEGLFSFSEEITRSIPTFEELNHVFLAIPKADRGFIRKDFNRYKAALMDKNVNECAEIVKELYEAFSRSENPFSQEAYKFIAYASCNCNKELRLLDVSCAELFAKADLYDFAATEFYLCGDYEKAAACAVISMSADRECSQQNKVLTILQKTSDVLKDYSGVATALDRNRELIFDNCYTELIRHIYTDNGEKFSASINVDAIKDALKKYSSECIVSSYVNRILEGNFADIDAEEDVAEAESISADTTLSGKIVKLSWSSERGTIDSDGALYNFVYQDVKDQALLARLKKILVSDLTANNKEVDVSFEIVNGKAVNIKKLVKVKEVVSKPSGAKTEYIHDAHTLEEKINGVEKAPDDSTEKKASFNKYVGMTNLQIGRAICAEKDNDNRFVEGLMYFEKALELEQDTATAIEEIVKCSLVIHNKDGDSSHLENAYGIYEQHKDLFVNNGLKHNTTLYDLFVKVDDEAEKEACLDRILADKLLNPNTRIHYTAHRADLYFTLAEKQNNQDRYLQAINEYRVWEQLYNDSGFAHFKKMFYELVLYRIALCLYKTGDVAKSKETLDRVLRVDKTHEKARDLLCELAMSGELEEEPDLKALAVEFVVEAEDAIEEAMLECEYVDPSGWSALGLTEKDIVDYVLSIEGEQRLPYSLTYLKAVASLNSNFENIYTQLSLATDNPMEMSDYSLQDLLSKFMETSLFGEEFSNYCMVAAYARGSFYYTTDKDYYPANDYVCGSMFSHLPSLSKAISAIDAFRVSAGRGIDYYADYRNSNTESFGENLKRILAEAATIYETYFTRIFAETVSQRRFKLAKAHLFRNGGILERMVACVKDNNISAFEKIKDEFCDYFIRNGMTLSINNIYADKIEDVIEEAWRVAGNDDSVAARKSSDLMGGLRNNLRSAINKCVKVVCQWYELAANNSSADDANRIKYQKSKKELVPLLESLVSECAEYSCEDDKVADFGCHMIAKLAQELISRLNGTYNSSIRDYYFVDFLRTDHILLNEKYMPDLSSTFSDLPEFNVLCRIRKHIANEEATLLEHAANIYTRDEERHDYGTAKLIADYLKANNRESEWQLPENVDEFEAQAKKQLKLSFENFNRDVSMAFSNGQTNVSDKFMNNVEETAQYWYQNSLETKNFGFFARLIDNCNTKIHDDAIAFGEIIRKQLEALKREENVDQSIVDMIEDHIENQWFIVAEDWMGRISKGDFDATSDAQLEAEKILMNFWEEFEDIYNTVYPTAFNLRRVVINSSMPCKDRRGGEALINNWIENENKTNENRISTLLTLLGWEHIKVTEKFSSSKQKRYHVEDCSPTAGKKLYMHPIPDFGSCSHSNGFSVVCLYGYSDSERLINEYKNLDTIVGNKIILLDYALSAVERRALAKKIKQTHLASTYLLIDRVTISYIANHYMSGVNNKTLMAITLPFSHVQPYVVESSHTMPPEMFIGRNEELLSIESATGANLIFGGRQLGKSALLKKAKTEIDDKASNRHAVYIDINKLGIEKSAEKVFEELVLNGILSPEEKTSDWGVLTGRLRSAIVDKDINYVLLMLDEADEFIKECKDIGYQPLVFLKDIQQALDGKFKFVLAGLHDIVKFNRDVALGRNSVITHFTSINIKPFNYDDGKELLTKPLSYLGFTFDNDETVISHILSTTNYYPVLIQLYSKRLIEAMSKKDYAGYNETNTPPYFITPSHISKVLSDKDFVDEIKNKFEITLALDDEYYLIALMIAYLFTTEENSDGYTVEQIMKSIKTMRVDCLKKRDKDQIETLLEELCDLNVLKKSGGRYLFRTKSFRDLLGSEDDITVKLLELITKNEPEEDD